MSDATNPPPADQDRCDCCRFKTKRLSHLSPDKLQKAPEHWVCALCYSSMVGVYFRSHEYPSDTIEILKSINFVGNAVIASIEELARGLGRP